jgi:hypothetical protein
MPGPTTKSYNCQTATGRRHTRWAPDPRCNPPGLRTASAAVPGPTTKGRICQTPPGRRHTRWAQIKQEKGGRHRDRCTCRRTKRGASKAEARDQTRKQTSPASSRCTPGGPSAGNGPGAASAMVAIAPHGPNPRPHGKTAGRHLPAGAQKRIRTMRGKRTNTRTKHMRPHRARVHSTTPAPAPVGQGGGGHQGHEQWQAKAPSTKSSPKRGSGGRAGVAGLGTTPTSTPLAAHRGQASAPAHLAESHPQVESHMVLGRGPHATGF